MKTTTLKLQNKQRRITKFGQITMGLIVRAGLILASLNLAFGQTAAVITDFVGSGISTTYMPARTFSLSGTKSTIAFDASTNGQLFASSNTQQQFRGGMRVEYAPAAAQSYAGASIRSTTEGWEPSKFLAYTDNGTSPTYYSSVFVWTKDKFLNNGSSNTVSFDNTASSSYITINVTSVASDTKDLRFVVKNGSTYYISEFSITAAGSYTLTGFNNSSTVGKRWGTYDPTTLAIPNPLPSFTAVNLNGITEIGLAYNGGRPQYGHAFGFDKFKVSALVGSAPPAGGPSGYAYCSDENQNCVLSGTMDLAYGANGVFAYKTNQTGTCPCNNGNFGDPIPGVVKKCYTKASVTGGGNHPPLGAGLDGIADYSHSRWFVDVMKHSRVFGVFGQPWVQYTGSFNATTYYPTQSFSLIVISGIDPTHEAFMYGTYKLSFKGQATVTSGSNGTSVANAAYNSTTGITTVDVSFTGGDNQVFLNFANPVNMDQLKMISPGYSTTNPPLVRTEMVKVLTQFNQFRFMDWLATNGNPVVSWADRHLPSLPGTVNRNNAGAGCAWEDVAAFANQLNKDVWINIPINANDDFVTQCATLLKNNLNPNSKVYIEYSNEVWNFSFSQFFDNLNSANAEVNAGGSTLNNDGETNQYSWASRRVVKRAYEISNLFKNVWGASQINNRVRVVVAGQLTYSHGGDLDWFNRTYGAPKNFFWGIANAPYWNDKPLDDNNTSATVSQLLDQLEANKNALFDNRVMDYAPSVATYYGLEMMGYEGGPDTFGPNNQQAKADLNFDPRMKTISADFLTRWYQNGCKQFNWFVIGSAGNYVGQYGTWALLGWLQDSTTNMKYQGMKQVLTGTMPAVTAGLPIPGTYNATQTVGYPNSYAATKAICANPAEVNYDTYFLNVPAAGNYNFSVRTNQGTNNIKIRVYVNNVVMPGTVTTSVLAGYNSSSVLPITLPAGLVTIKVAYTGVDRNLGCLNQQDFTISTGSPRLEDVATEATPGEQVEIYPNPATSIVYINTASEAGGDITISDSRGRIVSNTHVNTKISTLALPGLNAGIYLVRVSTPYGITVKKLAIQ